MKKSNFIALCVFMLGMICSVNAQFTNYTTTNSDLPSDYVVGGVVIDTNNNVWVGTDAGVAKFDGATWTVYTTADGLPVDIISCIAVDKITNNVWIGTDGDGVAKYDGSTWTKYTFADGLCDNGIHYIAGDPDGSIWFGSWGAGVSKLNGTTWTTYTDADGLPSDAGAQASIYYIYVDASNNKWFGTDLGLVKYNNTAFSTINQTTTPDLRSNYITSVAVDGSNNRWLGVSAKGIAKLNSTDSWVANYDTINGIYGLNAGKKGNHSYEDLEFDSQGNLWIGGHTPYGALMVGAITKFNPATETGVSYATADGLVNEQIFSIAIDGNDDVWIATGAGLSKFHDAVGITENNNNLSLDIFPNPAQDYLYINGSIRSGVAQISDISGRIVSALTVSSPAKINIENLDNGIYFIIVTENDKNYIGKFIKE